MPLAAAAFKMEVDRMGSNQKKPALRGLDLVSIAP